MKIYSRIIPKTESHSQKVSPSSSKEDFRTIFQNILASQTPKTSSNVTEKLPSVPEATLKKTEHILQILEVLSQNRPSPKELEDLQKETLSLWQDIAHLPAGPSRQVLEEVALLGAVEAEKYLA